jgi:hypothetical protein
MAERRQGFDDPNYESHQPPLYYALAVPFFLAGRATGIPEAEGQACRVLSVLLGLVGTWLVWLLAREIVPGRRWLQWAAAAFAALLPMRLAIMGSVSNDSLTEAVSSLALLLMVRAIRGPFGLREAALIGGAVSLALLSKQSSILLLPPTLLALVLAARNAAPPAPEAAPAPSPRGKKRKGEAPPAASAAPKADWTGSLVRAGLVTGGVILLLSGWWFVRNHLLYGDPLGQRAFNWYFADTPTWEGFRAGGMSYGEYLGRLVWRTAFASFWGAFGHLERPELFMGATGGGYPPKSWLYPLLGWATWLSVAGGVLWYWRWKRRPDDGACCPAGLGVLALHALFVAAAFLNFNATYFQAQGRYLFPAIGVLSLGIAGGWLELARRYERGAALGIAAVMTALAVYALFGVVSPAFQRPLF